MVFIKHFTKPQSDLEYYIDKRITKQTKLIRKYKKTNGVKIWYN